MSTQVTLVGRIGAEPSIHFGATGKAIARLRVVTNGRKIVDGKWTDVDTSWWSVVAFGNLAEPASELPKGQAVIIVGKAKEDTYTDKEGNERKSVSIVADSIGTQIKSRQPTRMKADDIAATDDPWAVMDPAHAPF